MGDSTLVRRRPRAAAFTVAALCLVLAGNASAGVADWQVNEVVLAGAGDSSARFVELANPVGGCIFPSSRVIVYDPDGGVVDSASIVSQTTCFGPDTFFLMATSAAVSLYGVTADVVRAPQIPAGAGQLCFVSSSTRYDCVRWGTVATAVTDFFGPGDVTSAMIPAADQALVRVATTHVVVDDWTVDAPTPRGPNDGTPWTPPDAGPTPDAAPVVDAAPPSDARPRPDAGVDARQSPDSGQRFLDLDPAGGALCSCRGGEGQPGAALVIALACLGVSVRFGRAKGTGRRGA